MPSSKARSALICYYLTLFGLLSGSNCYSSVYQPGFIVCVCQEQSERGQQQSLVRIAQLEREASDSRDIHLALAAQHESKVPSLPCPALHYTVLYCTALH